MYANSVACTVSLACRNPLSQAAGEMEVSAAPAPLICKDCGPRLPLCLKCLNEPVIMGGKIGGCRGLKLVVYKFEKQAEILIDKYYSCAKVIHKVVLDIY